MKSDKTQRGPKGFILLEPGNIMQILPEDNKSWLTLFYSLPEELVSKRPAYMNLPRCPFDVIRSNDYSKLLNTDVFLELGVAPFFGSHTENHDCFGGFLCFLR